MYTQSRFKWKGMVELSVVEFCIGGNHWGIEAQKRCLLLDIVKKMEGPRGVLT